MFPELQHGQFLASLWRTPLYADVELRLEACVEGISQPLPAHAVVLCSASPVLLELLCAMTAGAQSAPRLTMLTLPVPPNSSSEAMMLALQAMYDSKCLDMITSKQALFVLIAADQLAADGIMKVAVQRLISHTVRPDGLDWQTVLLILSLPNSLLTSPLLQPLVQYAMQRIRHELGDLEATWQQLALRAQWLQLPWAGVLHLLTCSQCKAASENTVFCALTDWLEVGCGKGTPPAMTAQLLQPTAEAGLRVRHLSPSFFFSTALTRPWLAGAAAVLAAAKQQPASEFVINQYAAVAEASTAAHTEGTQLPAPHAVAAENGGLLMLCSQYALAAVHGEALQAVQGVNSLSAFMNQQPRKPPSLGGELVVEVPLHKLRVGLEALQPSMRSAQHNSHTAGMRTAPLATGMSYTNSIYALEDRLSTVLDELDGLRLARYSSRRSSDRQQAASSPNIVPSPCIVWAGYVWAMDVFVAQDNGLALGVSVHALHPAIGMPSQDQPDQPAATVTHTAAPTAAGPSMRTPTGMQFQPRAADAVTRQHRLGAVTSPTASFRSSTANTSTRHSTRQTESMAVVHSVGHQPALQAAGSSSSHTTCTASSTSVPPLLDSQAAASATATAAAETSVAPCLPPSGMDTCCIAAKLKLSVWNARYEKWEHLYESQVLASHTRLQLLPAGAESDTLTAETLTDLENVSCHAHRYQTTYADYFSVWSDRALMKLVYEPQSWYRLAYAPQGRLKLRAQLLSVQ